MRRQGGFTVTELMVVVAIVAILLGLGVPSFRYVTNAYRMSAEINGLLGDLQYARAEAIRRGQPVTACVSTNGTACTGGSNWAGGWIVFSDPNGNQTVDAAEVIVRRQAAFTGTTRDTFNASGGLTAITYNREGFATTAAGFPNTTITLRDPSSNAVWTRCLWITPIGTLTTETPTTIFRGPARETARGDRRHARLQPHRGHGVAGRDLRRASRDRQAPGAVALEHHHVAAACARRHRGREPRRGHAFEPAVLGRDAPVGVTVTASGAPPAIASTDAALQATTNTDLTNNPTNANPSAVCIGTVGGGPQCTAVPLAAFDLARWTVALAALLPNATAAINCPPVAGGAAPASCTIQIAWTEQAVAVNAQEAQATTTCNPLAAGGQQCFQVPTYTLYVEP